MRPPFHPTRTPATAAAVLLVAVVGSTLAGCSAETGNAQPTSPSPTLSTTDARADALRKSEEAVRKWRQLPDGKPVGGDFIDPHFAKSENDRSAAWRASTAKSGVKMVVKFKQLDLLRGKDYSASPLGTTVILCSTSNIRLIDTKGVDVTRDERGQPIPDKPIKNAVYFTLDSKDGGVTWQINGISEAPLDACSPASA